MTHNNCKSSLFSFLKINTGLFSWPEMIWINIIGDIFVDALAAFTDKNKQSINNKVLWTYWTCSTMIGPIILWRTMYKTYLNMVGHGITMWHITVPWYHYRFILFFYACIQILHIPNVNIRESKNLTFRSTLSCTQCLGYILLALIHPGGLGLHTDESTLTSFSVSYQLLLYSFPFYSSKVWKDFCAFERIRFCSPRLHLSEQKYSKTLILLWNIITN